MILRNVLDLQTSIGEYRKQMYVLAKNKGMTDPDTIKTSQELDKRIVSLQKIIAKINCLS